MIIKNRKINEFLKQFYNEYKSEFVFRVRGDKNIVYYNGIKAFTIDKYYKNDIKLSLFEETFKCNPTAIKNLEITPLEYKKQLENLCMSEDGISKICNFLMTKITFEISSLYDYNKIIKKINAFIEKYSNLFNKNAKEKIVKNIEDEIFRIEKEAKLKNKNIKDIKRKKIVISFEKVDNVKDIINIQFDFLNMLILEDNKLLQSTIKSIKFDYKIKDKKENKANQTKQDIDKNLKIFINAIKNTIDNYNGKDGLEKKYQHQFMLSKKTNKLFKTLKENKNVFPFEQEYYIIEKDNKKYFKKMDGNGRIDAIYLGLENNKVKDIYLIELKVNENVVGGENGVHKHLDNIRDLFDEKNNKAKDIFFENILKRFKTRMEILENNNIEIPSLKNLKYHFYTIIAFTDTLETNKITKQKENIVAFSEEFNNHYQNVVNILKDFKEEKTSFNLEKNILPDKYKNSNMLLPKIVKDIEKNCDVKLIFDMNKWLKEEYDPSFIDKTHFFK